jgi:hypothetical protein
MFQGFQKIQICSDASENNDVSVFENPFLFSAFRENRVVSEVSENRDVSFFSEFRDFSIFDRHRSRASERPEALGLCQKILEGHPGSGACKPGL